VKAMLIDGMQGLGDNLYQRAILREVVKVRQVYLMTPWPQLYSDLPVRCVKSQTLLRTQAKNLLRPSTVWCKPPPLIDRRRWHYSIRHGTMLQALCDDLGMYFQTVDFSGPPVEKVNRKPYIVVRPVTQRIEWKSESRGPKPEYLVRAVEALRQQYKIVSIADIQPPYETAVEPLPYADETYNKGELSVEQLLALVAGATAVVGGVGFIVPMSIAYQVPLLLIYGGCLAHNGPQRILDPRIDTRKIYQVLPDNPCMCNRSDHKCVKTISVFDKHIERFMERLNDDGRKAA